MCANNLRQHGVAWYLYLDDHNDCFPKYADPPWDVQCSTLTFGGKAGAGSGYESYIATMRPLNRYLDVDNTSSAEIFHCPDDIKGRGSLPEMDKTIFDYYGTSYLFNQSILQFGPDKQRPLSTITNPRSNVLMEKCTPTIKPGHGGKGEVPPNTPVMVLFVDGHVKGPYLYPSECGGTPTDTESPVYLDPNTTPDEYD